MSQHALTFSRPLNGIKVILPGRESTPDCCAPIIEDRSQPVPSLLVPPSTPPAPAPISEELFQELIFQLREVESSRAQSLREMQELSLELAIIAAEHLIARSLEVGQFGIDSLIRALLQQFSARTPIEIRLNPTDLELLHSQLQSSQHSSEFPSVSFRADPSLPRGSCRADSPTFGFKSDISTRLDDIRQAWREELHHAQSERRATEAPNASLRRFPDRRETPVGPGDGHGHAPGGDRRAM